LPAGRVGLRFSKVRVPGGGGEALVPTSSWNKSSLALPRPVGVMLRCRRRASGGGVPFVNSLFRSPGLVVRRCLWVAASVAFFVKVVEPAVGFVEEGWLGLPRAFLCGGGHRWRVKTQDLGSLGVSPVDGRLPMASPHPSRRVSYSTPLKATG
jgi:hypothetical protein